MLSNRTYRLAVLNSHPIQYFVPLYRRLSQEPDIDLTVYFCSRQGVEEYEDAGFGVRVKWDVPLLEGYRHVFLPNLRSTDGVGGFLSLANPAVVRELIRQRYDALWVHGHNYATYLMAIAAAKAVGTRVFMRGETHLGLSRPSLKGAVRKPVMSGFYRLCDAVLPIGRLNADFYRAHGVPEAKMFPVPYTVDNEYFAAKADQARGREREIRRRLGLPEDQPCILYASKLVDRKRPLDLLRAFHRLRKAGGEATLAIVGSGPEEGALQEYAREHSVPSVHFLGFRNQSELPELYAVADIFVLPSEDEPWGLILNEVMCAGCPVVAADGIGAVPDLVLNGETGYTFPTGDVERLAERLERLVRDPGLRERMGARARERMEQWSYEQCVAGVRAALQATRHAA